MPAWTQALDAARLLKWTLWFQRTRSSLQWPLFTLWKCPGSVWRIFCRNLISREGTLLTVTVPCNVTMWTPKWTWKLGSHSETWLSPTNHITSIAGKGIWPMCPTTAPEKGSLYVLECPVCRMPILWASYPPESGKSPSILLLVASLLQQGSWPRVVSRPRARVQFLSWCINRFNVCFTTVI